MIKCKYCEKTNEKWLKNTTCKVYVCGNPVAPYGITGVVRSHCRVGSNNRFEVRSKSCNAKYCNNYTEDKNTTENYAPNTGDIQ